MCSSDLYMKDHGGGRIINIGSISAQTPRQHSAPYAATKMAMEGLTRSLTLDGRPFNIVSSVIHPGPTASNFNKARGGPGKGKTPADIDFVVVRENTEGEYSSVGGRMYPDTDREIVMQQTIMSRAGVDRILKYAFELAQKSPKKHLTSATDRKSTRLNSSHT